MTDKEIDDRAKEFAANIGNTDGTAAFDFYKGADWMRGECSKQLKRYNAAIDWILEHDGMLSGPTKELLESLKNTPDTPSIQALGRS